MSASKLTADELRALYRDHGDTIRQIWERAWDDACAALPAEGDTWQRQHHDWRAAILVEVAAQLVLAYGDEGNDDEGTTTPADAEEVDDIRHAAGIGAFPEVGPGRRPPNAHPSPKWARDARGVYVTRDGRELGAQPRELLVHAMAGRVEVLCSTGEHHAFRGVPVLIEGDRVTFALAAGRITRTFRIGELHEVALVDGPN